MPRIWAFEPNSENYQCALITLHLNRLQNVELINAGLGDQQDFLTMMTTDTNGKARGGASRIVTQDHEKILSGIEMVKIVTIDEIVPANRKVSIIHLDVEGYEEPALSGALKTIQRCLPIIIVESLPKNNWLAENIWPLGYRISQTVHHNTVLTPK